MFEPVDTFKRIFAQFELDIQTRAEAIEYLRQCIREVENLKPEDIRSEPEETDEELKAILNNVGQFWRITVDVLKIHMDRVCEACGNSLLDKSWRAKYCCAACRCRAKERRRRGFPGNDTIYYQSRAGARERGIRDGTP